MVKSNKNLKILNSKKGLLSLLLNDRVNLNRTLRYVKYEKRLNELQEELIKLQEWVIKEEKKIVIVFEGRDAAGKGGAIRRFTEYLNPRIYRVVALPKPNEVEKNQWYFQRYIQHLPKAGEMVFFDRSWYNRAVVEPVNGFCSQEEYQLFMKQVNSFEEMVVDSGTQLFKLYFSISKKEQANRFRQIQNSPVKKWKFSDVDAKAQDLWDDYTEYKLRMFEETNTSVAPWKVIKANRKTQARIRAIEYILKLIPYEGRDPEVVKHKNVHKDHPDDE